MIYHKLTRTLLRYEHLKILLQTLQNGGLQRYRTTKYACTVRFIVFFRKISKLIRFLTTVNFKSAFINLLLKLLLSYLNFHINQVK